MKNDLFNKNKPSLTAQENLELHCEYIDYYDKAGINPALDLVKLHNIDNKKVKDFSLGMKQRLGIARAISTIPELFLRRGIPNEQY